ncbi:MAG: PKD domain-containing protein [Anaerolineae bacterium]|nr:PKD domain-containing protein [Anaerolineae bacterium]
MSNRNNPFQSILENWSKFELTLLGIFVALLVGAIVLFAVLGSIFLSDRPASEISDLPTDEASQPAVSLSPNVGSAGSTVTVQGDGWPVGSRIVIYFVPLSPPRYAVNSTIVNPDGRFSVDIIVPSDPRWLSESPVPVLAQTDDEQVSAQALLTISSPADIPSLTPAVPEEIEPPEPEPTSTPPPPDIARLTVNTDLNVREGPGVEYDILGVLLYGQTAEITGRTADGTWWQIRYESAASDFGWVAAQFSTAENIENVPIVASPARPTVTPAPSPTATPVPGIVITDWRGEYYNNRNLSGSPVLVRNDVAVSFDWGQGSPAPEVPADNFSARWTRTLDFSAGAYRFYTRTDDGTRLWVDGNLLIDEWRETAPATHSADIYLTGGAHSIKMEYFDATSGALAVLGWERIDTFPDWKAEYFNNVDLAGSPVLVRNESSINHDWGNGSPGSAVQADNFSARWTRRQSFEGGDYIFRLRSDDGVRVWVDNNLVYDHWQDGDTGNLEFETNIAGGVRDLKVEYYERTGLARIELGWQRQDDVTNNPPIAVISSPSEAVVGQPVKFDGGRSRRGDYPIVDYEWEFGDGKEANDKQVNHTYTSPGTYRVRLTVRDSAGLRDRTSVDIEINEEPQPETPPIPVIVGPAAAQVGQTVSFDASRSQSANSIVNYNWTFGDGTGSTGVNVQHIYRAAGLYNVNLTLVDDKGLRGSTNVTVRIDEQPAPVAVINAPDTAKVGQPVNFDGSGSTASAQIVSYDWEFGDGGVASGSAVSHTFDSSAFYNVRLTVIDANGFSNSTSRLINIEAGSPTATKSPTTAPTTTLVPAPTLTPTLTTVTPTATGTNSPTPTATGTLTPTATSTLTPTATLTPTVTQTPTNTPTVTSTPTLTPTATATDVPSAPLAIISGPSSAQVGQSVALSAGASQSASPITQYAWQLGDGAQANTVNVTHVYTAPGVYPISLTITNQDALTDTAQSSIQIESPPATQPPPLAVITGPSTVKVGQVITLNASASQSIIPIVSYSWNWGDGMLSSGVVATHTYTAVGTYTTILTISSQNTLTDTTQTVIEVVP